MNTTQLFGDYSDDEDSENTENSEEVSTKQGSVNSNDPNINSKVDETEDEIIEFIDEDGLLWKLDGDDLVLSSTTLNDEEHINEKVLLTGTKSKEIGIYYKPSWEAEDTAIKETIVATPIAQAPRRRHNTADAIRASQAEEFLEGLLAPSVKKSPAESVEDTNLHPVVLPQNAHQNPNVLQVLLDKVHRNKRRTEETTIDYKSKVQTIIVTQQPSKKQKKASEESSDEDFDFEQEMLIDWRSRN